MSSDYQRVEQAIHYLEENFRAQPTLDELAANLSLSPFHLQRLFKRWAGISPKRFVQFLSADYAKELLRTSASVLDATYETGLSSPSRLHDLMISVQAVTPGEYKNGGAGLNIRYGFHESPFGECLLATTERGICAFSFLSTELNGTGRSHALSSLRADWPAADLIEEPQSTAPLLEQIFPKNVLELPEEDTSSLTRYAEPLQTPTQLNLLLRGTNFQVKVWEALLKIPTGTVCSYQDIAELIGKPSAARAVGSAVGSNQIAFLIPCHRVIRKNGIVKDYRWGATRKKALLGWEAAQVA